MLAAMEEYCRFLYTIVDVRTSDKSEWIDFNETANGAIDLKSYKLSKSGDKEQILFANTFNPEITKEIRLFVGKGDDVLRINTPTSTIKLRIVGGEGEKTYEVSQAKTKIDIYENLDKDRFIDPNQHLAKHLSNDSLNTKKVFSDLYQGSGIAPTANIRSVDGIFLGLAYTIKKEGFRKEPYGSMQKIAASHSLSTKSFIVDYSAEWKEVFKKTNFTINAFADMKGNILNYFGRGNETIFDQGTDFRRFYRVNFSYYKVAPALRLALSKRLSVSAGPTFQYFSMGDNTGRYINSSAIGAAARDIFKDKAHGGIFMNLTWNNSDHHLFPTKGLNFSMLLQGYEGLNKTSKAYAQVFPQLSFYKSLDAKGRFVIANRIGAGFTMGTAAFYQSAFLGGQDNLLGFRKFRFAGDNIIYNNLEARFSLPNFLHYVLPGKMGLIGFYDVGRVWVKNEESDRLHQGVGGGVFLVPFSRFFVRAVAGYAEGRWQPTISLRQRF